MDAEMTALSRSLVYEIAGSVGSRDSPLAHRIVWPIFRPVTDRLARIGITFDRNVVQHGFAHAMGFALKDFIHTVTARGIDDFPPQGPLLVFSNHPGTYDSLIIASHLRRDDLCLISGDIPFLRRLPHANKHFYFVKNDPNTRMAAARQAIRHLKEGGAVLVYGFGHIDPDPAVYNDTSDHIDQWSRSIDLFLKTVPEINLLISIVSHVVSPKWRRSLLYHLRRNPIDRRRLVEFGQVMTQLLFPGTFKQSPFISFTPPLSVPELRRGSASDRLLPTVIARGKALLAEHMAWTEKIAT
ncbi:MAG: 1-acyl-sn-glycerol-3-phosphate acyltransferase [Chloroflexota bacterium]